LLFGVESVEQKGVQNLHIDADRLTRYTHVVNGIDAGGRSGNREETCPLTGAGRAVRFNLLGKDSVACSGAQDGVLGNGRHAAPNRGVARANGPAGSTVVSLLVSRRHRRQAVWLRRAETLVALANVAALGVM
jgi:hypothetical protein